MVLDPKPAMNRNARISPPRREYAHARLNAAKSAMLKCSTGSRPSTSDSGAKKSGPTAPERRKMESSIVDADDAEQNEEEAAGMCRSALMACRSGAIVARGGVGEEVRARLGLPWPICAARSSSWVLWVGVVAPGYDDGFFVDVREGAGAV